MDLNKFSYKVYLPTLKKYGVFYEFNGDQYLTIAKYIQNDDNPHVVQFFNKLVTELCVNNQVLNGITRIDLFCILLNMRILCVSDKMEMMLRPNDENEHPQKIVFDLYDILDRVTNYEMDYTQIIKIDKGVKVKLKSPSELYMDTSDQVISSIIDTLYILDKKYDFTKLNKTQQKTVLNSLPSSVLTGITDRVNEIDKNYSINVLDGEQFKLVAERDAVDFNLRMYDNSFYEFLKLLYGCNLEEQYYIRYLMVKQMGFNLSDVSINPPHITNTYINLFRKELDEQKKQSEKNNNPTGGMSLPQQNFTQ